MFTKSTSRFDEYVALLNMPAGDHRARVLFDAVIENVAKRAGVRTTPINPTNLQFENVPEVALAKNYMPPHNRSIGTDKIAVGWLNLISDIAIINDRKALTQDQVKKLTSLESSTNFNDAVAGLLIRVLLDVNTTKYSNTRNLVVTLEGLFNIVGGTITPTRLSNDFELKLNLNKYYLGLIFSESLTTAKFAVSPELVDTSTPSTPVDPDEPKYVRNTNGELCVVQNGVLTPIGKDSVHFKALIDSDPTTNKCLYTGFTDSGVFTCRDYFVDCLSGKDIEKCKVFLQVNNFWGTAQDEVKNMHPAIAVKTLEAFGFKTQVTNGVKHIETYAQWIEGLRGMAKAGTKNASGGVILNDTEVQRIVGNDKLTGYLNMLVNKINNNSEILNPGRSVSGTPSDSGSYFGKFGVQPRPYGSSSRGTSSDYYRLHNAIVGSRPASVALRIGTGLSSPLVVPILSGGSSGILEELESYKADENKHTSHLFEQLYGSFIARLNSMSKSVSQGDDSQIKQLITSLKSSEKKLFDVMVVTQRYATLLQVHGEKDPSTTLTYSDLNKFVQARSKYFDRTVRKQDALLNILNAIQQVINNAATTASTSAPAKVSSSQSSIDWSSLLRSK